MLSPEMDDRRFQDDQLRHREVHRHLPQSAGCPGVTVPQPSTNPALSAFAKLVAWRLKASRAIVSLIDRECQYVVADSNAPSSDADQCQSSRPHDSWPGRAKISISDLPCGKTLKLSSPDNGQKLCIVPDLNGNDHFRHLPLVSGPPFLRFYAGAPIKSPEGIAIGTFFVLDEISRRELTPNQELYLLEMAENAAQIMETSRAANECQRRMKMDKGLKSLLTRDHLISTITKISPTTPSDGVSYQLETMTSSSKVNLMGAKNDTSKLPPVEPDQNSSWSDYKPGLESCHTRIGESLSIFNEAADILYTSLGIHNNGGVLFLDLTKTGSANVESRSLNDFNRGTTRQKHVLRDWHQRTEGPFIAAEEAPMQPQNLPVHPGYLENELKILASRTSTTRQNVENLNTDLDFGFLKRRSVSRLAEVYLDGRLWNCEDLDAVDSEGSKCEQEYPPQSNSELDHAFHGAFLSACFPNARQIIFAPFKGSNSADSNIACFCWTTSADLNWSEDLDVDFCIRLGYILMREASKLDYFVEDKQKKDFLDIFSHELRSPLHGILASAELLDETRHDLFQKSLVGTIACCGRTLLDTINHILDYNEVKSLMRGLELGTSQSQPLVKFNSMPIEDTAPISDSHYRAGLDVYAETNIASLCEEVVGGLWAGQRFRGIFSTEPGESTADDTGKSLTHESRNYRVHSGQPSKNPSSGGNAVEVHLDIQLDDWHFLAPRGALCRIFMNIVGNALKYTENGWIKIKLETTSPNGSSLLEQTRRLDENSSVITFTVTDSGKGISAKFLRTKLYTAFSQEDTTAQGTGLGLNLVQSIVNTLHGAIRIESQLGIGTEVKVQFSFKRARAIPNKGLSPQVTGDNSQRDTNSLAELGRLGEGRSIAIYGFQESGRSQPRPLEGILVYYVTEWLGTTNVLPWSASCQADITIVEEFDMADLLSHGLGSSSHLGGPIIIVLCNEVVKHNQRAAHSRRGRILEFVTKPVGPYKLAEALRRGLRRESEAKRKFVNMFSLIEMAGGDINGARVETKNFSEYHHSGKPEPYSSYYHQRTLSDEEITSDEESIIGFSPVDYSQFYRKRADTLTTDRPSKLDLLPLVLDDKVDRSPTTTDPSRRGIEVSKTQRLTPTILIVDDNNINLQLLEAFMKKRRYTQVSSAVNGQLAVQAVEESSGFDVILMDISMPVLNGFQATRAIRAIEASRQEQHVSGPSDRSLIVALTGLASSRDRAEAFAAGVDLYMIKPVSLRAVGRLLDEWETKRGMKESEVEKRDGAAAMGVDLGVLNEGKKDDTSEGVEGSV